MLIGRISTVTLLRQEKHFSQDRVCRTGPGSPINHRLPPKLKNAKASSSIDISSMREASSDDIACLDCMRHKKPPTICKKPLFHDMCEVRALHSFVFVSLPNITVNKHNCEVTACYQDTAACIKTPNTSHKIRHCCRTLHFYCFLRIKGVW